jgi:hypothetical protein
LFSCTVPPRIASLLAEGQSVSRSLPFDGGDEGADVVEMVLEVGLSLLVLSLHCLRLILDLHIALVLLFDPLLLLLCSHRCALLHRSLMSFLPLILSPAEETINEPVTQYAKEKQA